jgi:hypothetical protein
MLNYKTVKFHEINSVGSHSFFTYVMYGFKYEVHFYCGIGLHYHEQHW